MTIRSDNNSAGGYLMKAPSKPAKKETKQLPASHKKPNDPAKIAAEKSKVMSMPQWEKSATDAAMDRKVAKANGMTLAQYEGSKLDEKNDAKQLAAHNKAARKAK